MQHFIISFINPIKGQNIQGGEYVFYVIFGIITHHFNCWQQILDCVSLETKGSLSFLGFVCLIKYVFRIFFSSDAFSEANCGQKES